MNQTCAKCFQVLRIPSGLLNSQKELISLRKSAYGVNKYAVDNGLSVLNHVLIPKTKGFFACLEDLRDSLDAVYDVTIGYKPCCPTLLDNVFGVNPSEVHIHIRRIALNRIPTSEDEVGSWLMNTFQLKDQLLSKFYSQGHFPHEGTEGDLSTLKCLVNFMAVTLLIGSFILSIESLHQDYKRGKVKF
ncbi:lysophosphatidyl acyltransferase 5 [Euphorbia peplus]|nr:lysophosphatidyl acyltransferase 5 [Euphorbia peplus]